VGLNPIGVDWLIAGGELGARARPVEAPGCSMYVRYVLHARIRLRLMHGAAATVRSRSQSAVFTPFRLGNLVRRTGQLVSKTTVCLPEADMRALKDAARRRRQSGGRTDPGGHPPGPRRRGWSRTNGATAGLAGALYLLLVRIEAFRLPPRTS
jgi:hypothetical protein